MIARSFPIAAALLALTALRSPAQNPQADPRNSSATPLTWEGIRSSRPVDSSGTRVSPGTVKSALPASPDSAERRAEVAARGATVMPFDLERTRHEFRPLAEGGVQTVVARDSADATQVHLVREHLRETAQRFRRGDFSDPAFIHGADMPGLAELRAGSDRLRIEYLSVPGGARIRYTSSDPTLVEAVHRWFQAQMSDHGAHAHP